MTRARALVQMVLACVLVATTTTSSSTLARRAPGPGGTAVVAVPAELVGSVVEAHVYVPLLVPTSHAPGDTERTPLPGAVGFSSSALKRIDVDKSGRRWALAPVSSPSTTAASVARCLEGRGGGSFAAPALRAAGVTARVGVSGNDVVVEFNQPVFVLPALLAFCPLLGAQGTSTGAYALTAPGRLAWRSGSFDAPPLLGAIEVRGAVAGDKADVLAMATAAESDGGATLLAPWADVLVLVQGGHDRDDDPFGFTDPRSGVRGFRAGLRADLLAAAWASGRGGPTEALLPAGVAPARPLPSSAGLDRAPLALVPVAADAPRVSLAVEGSDALTEGVAERLAVILRARGVLLDLRRDVPVNGASELVRWRAPSRDAALALLAFVGARPTLLDDPTIKKALDARALLAAEAATRLGAALALERALLESRRVVPLLAVDRWLTVDPDLRGVVVRDDGVPMLDGAWWGNGR